MGKQTVREWLHTALVAVCAVSLIIIAVLLFRLPAALSSPSDVPSVNDSGVSASKTTPIRTAYGTILFPKEYAGGITHEEIRTETAVEEVFTCQVGGKKTELYRLVFGEPQAENFTGYIHVGDEAIPVTVRVGEIVLDEFNEDEQELLHTLSETLNQVLVSVTEWDGFTYE